MTRRNQEISEQFLLGADPKDLSEVATSDISSDEADVFERK